MATVQNGKLFSCGNHSGEITRGMLHFGDPSQRVCISGVPHTMTVRDIIHFLNPSMQDIENTRIVREVNHDSTYIVLLTFRTDLSAKEFYLNYDGIPFNSLEENTCKLLYLTRIETFTPDPAKVDEDLLNCTVCLDKMYPDVESIITILCNHSFHAHCLSQWSDTSCPICRYTQTPECTIESKCMVCSYEGESLWMCVICGYVACGRYINGHAYDHFSETQHTYAMQLTDNQVWDYAGDNYVHRLLANKCDGKPVEVEGGETYRQAEEKIETVQLEYTYLLTQQLESQRKYYEKLLKDSEKSLQKKTKELTSKNKKTSDDLAELQEKFNQLAKDRSALEKKFNSTQAKLTKMQTTLTEERQMNKCLTLNQEQFQQKVKNLEGEIAKRDAKIADLEEQQRDLMFYLDAKDKIENSISENKVSRDEVLESQIGVTPTASTSNPSRNSRRKNKNKDR